MDAWVGRILHVDLAKEKIWSTLLSEQLGEKFLSSEFMSEIFQAATGVPMQAKKLGLTGKRILTLEKCVNIRLGADRKFDDLPYRMMHEPAPPGSHQEGATNSPQELNMMLNRYNELHGWDSQTSWPYRETLSQLDLNDVANELQKLDKLPKKA